MYLLLPLGLVYVEAPNVFKLYCERVSWTDFLSGKNKVSRSGFMCHHLGRDDYVLSKSILRCYEAGLRSSSEG